MPGKPCGVRGRASRQQLTTACGAAVKERSGGGCADTAINNKAVRAQLIQLIVALQTLKDHWQAPTSSLAKK